MTFETQEEPKTSGGSNLIEPFEWFLTSKNGDRNHRSEFTEFTSMVPVWMVVAEWNICLFCILTRMMIPVDS